jgi:hypothetical protein
MPNILNEIDIDASKIAMDDFTKDSIKECLLSKYKGKTITQELIDLIKTEMMETLFVPSTRLSCDYKGDTLYSVEIIRKKYGYKEENF